MKQVYRQRYPIREHPRKVHLPESSEPFNMVWRSTVSQTLHDGESCLFDVVQTSTDNKSVVIASSDMKSVIFDRDGFYKMQFYGSIKCEEDATLTFSVTGCDDNVGELNKFHLNNGHMSPVTILYMKAGSSMSIQFNSDVTVGEGASVVIVR